MKKFLSLVLALVMALSLTTVVWGAGNTITVGTSGNQPTLADAITDANDGDTIQLLENVDLGTTGVTVSKKLTLNLGEFTITSTGANTVYVGTAGDLTINATTGGISNTVSGTWGNAIGNYGVVTINGGTFTGNSALYNFYYNTTTFGTATINGGTFLANATAIANGESAVLNCGDLTVDGGSIESLDSSAVLEVTDGAIEELLVTEPDYAPPVTETKISDGTVESLTVEAAVEDSIEISGGTFTDDVSDYVVDGKQLLANGTVVTTPAAGTPAPTLYVWDNAGAEWDAYYIATGADLDDLAQDASDNCLPCYCVNGEYFVEVKEAAATFKLVYGNAKVFLAPVDAEDVCYSAKASVLKVVDADDATCGDWFVDGLDEDDKYYISYDKKGVVVEGVYVAAKNGPVQILVNGKIVDVKSLTQADIKQLPHDWKGYDVVNYQYTTVKCANCGKVATLYANGTAAGKNSVQVEVGGTVLGYITAAANSFGAAGGAAPDKTVQSAETFDAGIAMYVGMSVLAATGSAVVIGKKKD